MGFFFHLLCTLNFITDHDSFFALVHRKPRGEFVITFSSFAKLTISVHALDPSFIFSSFLPCFPFRGMFSLDYIMHFLNHLKSFLKTRWSRFECIGFCAPTSHQYSLLSLVENKTPERWSHADLEWTIRDLH